MRWACYECVQQFVEAGGCECWMDESCNTDELVPEGCDHCGEEAANACGIGINSSISFPLKINQFGNTWISFVFWIVPFTKVSFYIQRSLKNVEKEGGYP